MNNLNIFDILKYNIVVDKFGTKTYFNKNNERHRDNGPAVRHTNGTVEWWINDKRHREDGPAIEYVNGSIEWWVDGRLHRTDGAAIEYYDGTQEYWINGEYFLKEGFDAYIKPRRI